MTRAPLLPVRLVDGVWTTEGVVEFAGQTYAAKVTLADRPPTSRSFPCFPDPSVFGDAVLPVDVDFDALRVLAEHCPNTDEAVMSFNAEAGYPGEEPIPVRAVLTATSEGDPVTPSRADVLTTLYTLVNDEQLRMYASIYAGFPRERLPGRGASLADLAAVVVDTATPEVWTKFVSSLSADRPKRYAEIALLRRWAPSSLPPRRIVALVALDGSGVHGLGVDLDAARAHALTTRDDDDPAWLDTLRAVTLSGEPAAVQALVEALSSVPAGGDVWEGT